jgi:hypothetical protein
MIVLDYLLYPYLAGKTAQIYDTRSPILLL